MKLYPFQQKAVAWLAPRKTALLALEMGLGKTAVAINALGEESVLVACPASARINWLREFSLFSGFPRDFTMVTGRRTEKWEPNVICSHDLLDSIPASFEFHTLVVDESHYFKSLTTKRSRLVFGKDGLVHRAERIWLLSGTPMPNHAAELWIMLFTFGYTELNYPQWVERYCLSYIGPHGLCITGTNKEKIPELRSVLKPLMYRKMVSQVLPDLPSISFSSHIVEPGPVSEKLTEELQIRLAKEQSLVRDLVSGFTGDKMMLALEALAGSISTLRRYSALQKVQPVYEIVSQELNDMAYEKIVIFCIHKSVVDELKELLSAYNPVSLTGETSATDRQYAIDEFQNDPTVRVFIGNIKAAGTAITLTAANQVLFLEQSWVPGDNFQAAARCRRIGTIKPVFVRFVGLANSIDEKVAMSLGRKTDSIAEAIDGQNDAAYIFS